MPQKLNIEYVKDFVSKKTNGTCEVLSEEYVNDRSPLLVRCKCGNVFERPFCKLRYRRNVQCLECKYRKASERYRLNFDYVVSEINKTGCEYVSGEYKNNNSLLTIRCRCGNLFQKNYAKFSQGQNRCPNCGTEALREAKRKYSVDFVKEKLNEKGYKILDENSYIDSITPFSCVCKRGHSVEIKFVYFLRNQSGCKKCAVMDNGGTNNWNYRDGGSKVMEALRHSVYFWRRQVREKYGNKCLVTGETKNVIVHHLVDFKTILEESSEELGILILEHIGDYDNYEDFIALKNKVTEKHTTSIGIPITRKVHVRFHKRHKQEFVTPEMFDDFLKEEYGISLLEALSPNG